MRNRLLLKLDSHDGYFSLGCWPIYPAELAQTCERLSMSSDLFVAIYDEECPEGFHPPEAHALRLCSPIRELGVACWSRTDFLSTLRDSSVSSRLIDLLVYCPINPPDDIVALSSSFYSFQYRVPLAKWGGFWAYLHDAEDAHFFVQPDAAHLRQLLHALLHDISNEESATCIEKILSLFPKMEADKVFELAIRGGNLSIVDKERWWNWSALPPDEQQG